MRLRMTKRPSRYSRIAAFLLMNATTKCLRWDVSEIAQHFWDEYSIHTLNILSKFELRRVARTLRTVSVMRASVRLTDDLGYASTFLAGSYCSHDLGLQIRESDAEEVLLWFHETGTFAGRGISGSAQTSVVRFKHRIQSNVDVMSITTTFWCHCRHWSCYRPRFHLRRKLEVP